MEPTTCLDCDLPLTLTSNGYWLDNEDFNSSCPVSLDDHRPTR